MNEVAPDPPFVLRTAIVGYGLAGSVFHAPLVASTPGMEVAAIVTSNAERQAQARSDFPTAAIFRSADELWAQSDLFDLVVVAAPNRAHVGLGLRSVESGIPVVIDKPLAPSLAEGQRLVEAGERAGVPVSCFQNRRWDGDFRTVRSLVDDGTLGKIYRFESRFERFRAQPKPGAWRERPDAEEAGGLLWDLGSHLIDQAMVLFGQPISVYGETPRRRMGAQVDDDTFVDLLFPGDVVAQLWMSVTTRLPQARFHVDGSAGTVETYGLDPQEAQLKDGLRPHQSGWGTPGTVRLATGDSVGEAAELPALPGSYETYYALVRDALVHGTAWPVPAREVLRRLAIIEAARESGETGQVVVVGVGDE